MLKGEAARGDDRRARPPGAVRQGSACPARPHVRRRAGARRAARAGRHRHPSRGGQSDDAGVPPPRRTQRTVGDQRVHRDRLLLAASGLARGKRITSHWSYLDTLRQPRRRHGRWRSADTSATATWSPPAGVSAGIDMALWLVGADRGTGLRAHRPALDRVRSRPAVRGGRVRADPRLRLGSEGTRECHAPWHARAHAAAGEAGAAELSRTARYARIARPRRHERFGHEPRVGALGSAARPG